MVVVVSIINALTAGPRSSNVKSMSLSRAGAEPAANMLNKFGKA